MDTGYPHNTITIVDPHNYGVIICALCKQSVGKCMEAKQCGRCPKCSLMSRHICWACGSHQCNICKCMVCSANACYCHFQCVPKESAMQRGYAVGDLRTMDEKESDELADALSNMNVDDNTDEEDYYDD